MREVVLATNPTTTGEATALHIADALRERAPDVASRAWPPACRSAATSSTPTRSRSAGRSPAAAPFSSGKVLRWCRRTTLASCRGGGMRSPSVSGRCGGGCGAAPRSARTRLLERGTRCRRPSVSRSHRGATARRTAARPAPSSASPGTKSRSQPAFNASTAAAADRAAGGERHGREIAGHDQAAEAEPPRSSSPTASGSSVAGVTPSKRRTARWTSGSPGARALGDRGERAHVALAQLVERRARRRRAAAGSCDGRALAGEVPGAAATSARAGSRDGRAPAQRATTGRLVGERAALRRRRRPTAEVGDRGEVHADPRARAAGRRRERSARTGPAAPGAELDLRPLGGRLGNAELAALLHARPRAAPGGPPGGRRR